MACCVKSLLPIYQILVRMHMSENADIHDYSLTIDTFRKGFIQLFHFLFLICFQIVNNIFFRSYYNHCWFMNSSNIFFHPVHSNFMKYFVYTHHVVCMCLRISTGQMIRLNLIIKDCGTGQGCS